jgi:hypothetical protein
LLRPPVAVVLGRTAFAVGMEEHGAVDAAAGAVELPVPDRCDREREAADVGHVHHRPHTPSPQPVTGDSPASAAPGRWCAGRSGAIAQSARGACNGVIAIPSLGRTADISAGAARDQGGHAAACNRRHGEGEPPRPPLRVLRHELNQDLPLQTRSKPADRQQTQARTRLGATRNSPVTHGLGLLHANLAGARGGARRSPSDQQSPRLACGHVAASPDWRQRAVHVAPLSRALDRQHIGSRRHARMGRNRRV